MGFASGHNQGEAVMTVPQDLGYSCSVRPGGDDLRKEIGSEAAWRTEEDRRIVKELCRSFILGAGCSDVDRQGCWRRRERILDNRRKAGLYVKRFKQQTKVRRSRVIVE